MQDENKLTEEYSDYEEWIYDNMIDESPSIKKEEPEPPELPEPEEEQEEESELSRMRGDSVQEARLKGDLQNSILLKLIIGITVIVIAALVFLKTFYNPVTVSGPSMYPTLEDGDILRTTTKITKQKITYDTIICFSRDGNKTIIKRVVGLPGDTVSFKNGYVYINGVKREDGFPQMEEYPQEEINLADDEYYVLGDNRNQSKDSRYYGPIKFSEITNIVRFNQTQDTKRLKEAFEIMRQYRKQEKERYNNLGTMTDATPTEPIVYLTTETITETTTEE